MTTTRRFLKGTHSGETPDAFCKDCARFASEDFDGSTADICANEHAPTSSSGVLDLLTGWANQLRWVDLPERPNDFAMLFKGASPTLPAETLTPMPIDEWERRGVRMIQSIAARIRKYGLVEG